MTYHNQACVGVVAMKSPGGMNWYLNNAIQVSLEKKFLSGYTTPLLKIEGCLVTDVSVIEYEVFNLKYFQGAIIDAIVRMIDCGKYVMFHSADDFYIKGKSWYGVRHLRHDGMVVGYDLEERTFTVLAYDSTWIFRSFSVPMYCFIEAYASSPGLMPSGRLTAMAPLKKEVPLDIDKSLLGVSEYLDSDMEKYPMVEDGLLVQGVVTLEYLAEYLERLRDGRIPYDRMDRRIIRLLLDHKSLMQKRLEIISKVLELSIDFGNQYREIVSIVEAMLFQYKKFELRPNMYILERMIDNMHLLYIKERAVLSAFLTMATSEKEKRKENENSEKKAMGQT
jgi:hypothetical protein